MKKTTTNTINAYEAQKAEIKARLEAEGKKYPTNTNGLTQEFIITMFAPILNKEDLKWLIEKRAECLKSSKEGKAENWFPAFRSAVGKKFFPEFSVKKTVVKVDEYEDFLYNLLEKAG